MHDTTYEALREVSPLLGSRSGLSHFRKIRWQTSRPSSPSWSPFSSIAGVAGCGEIESTHGTVQLGSAMHASKHRDALGNGLHLADFQSRTFRYICAQLRIELGHSVCKHRGLVAGTGDRNISEQRIEQIGMHSGIGVDENPLGGEPLRAVARDRVRLGHSTQLPAVGTSCGSRLLKGACFKSKRTLCSIHCCRCRTGSRMRFAFAPARSTLRGSNWQAPVPVVLAAIWQAVRHVQRRSPRHRKP